MSRRSTTGALPRRSRPIRPRPRTRRGTGPASCGSRARRLSRTRSSTEGARRTAQRARASCVVRVEGELGARLRHEEVGAAAIVSAQELDGRVALAERALERLAPRESPLERELRVARFQFLERARDLDEKMRRAHRLREATGALAVGAKQVRDTLALRVLKRRRFVLAAEALVGAVVSDRPLDVDAIGRKSLIELVGHRTVEVSVIRARVGAELPEVESSVARFERVHRPRDDLDALVEAVIALGLLELLREPAPSIRVPDCEHVRMVPEVVVVDPEESEHEARGLWVLRRVAERDETAVVHDREHELRMDDHVTAPELLLQRDGRRAALDAMGHVDAEFGHGY